MNTDIKAQIIYLSHGGGPLPLINDPSHLKLNHFLGQLKNDLRKPEAIVVFSAHWEADPIAIQHANHPPLIYDYYGFPEETYHLDYPANGHPKLAEKIASLLNEANIENHLDDQQPYDHGMYIPLMKIYPDASIPCIQISLSHSLDARTHLKLGEALRPLLSENILFIGSGFSFHNLRAFDMNPNPSPDLKNEAFQGWLLDHCVYHYEKNKSESALINWEKAPHARYCHPREEHLLPLHICVGLAQAQATCLFFDSIAGKKSIGLLWQSF